MFKRLKAAVAAFKGPKKKTPWVEIKGMIHGADRGRIKIDLDWNDEFVEYLRANGITGTSDELVVQKWITMLYQDIIIKQESEHVSDFE